MCGTAFPAATGRGRPRIYCGDVCRWRAGHVAAAEQARQRRAAQPEWPADDLPDQSFTDLIAWAETQQFGQAL